MIKFLDYTETPTEKSVGIATVMYNDVVLRYKLVNTTDGKSRFLAPSTYKITKDGVEKYIPSFYIDSRSKEEEIKDAVMAGIKQSAHPKIEEPIW